MCNSSNEHPIASGYRLIDFGQGRKLESFGGRILDRPSPAAEGVRRSQAEQWQRADSVFDVTRRQWRHHTPWSGDEVVQFPNFRMPIAPTPFGHIGVFPEQAENWQWLKETAPVERHAMNGLNLFAYTGSSSIAMAATGLKVAHVDAAKQNVSMARSAAELNGLREHPIRYLVDDAAKFVGREVRRGNRYHTIVMDPPAYGHSPKGKAWRLERDLWPLVDDCLSLLLPGDFRLLITGHSPQVGSEDVVDYLMSQAPEKLRIGAADFESMIDSGRLTLCDKRGRKLDAGFFVRCNSNLMNA